VSKTTAVATLNGKGEPNAGQVQLSFNADYNDDRNQAWAKYTPGLSVIMHVTESVAEQFEQGGRYLIDFTRDDGAREIPEGYEPQEHSFAKNHAMDALENELEKQVIDPYDEDNEIDLINLADAVVEALLAAGVTIPEGITNPHGIQRS
jgi:hypothetical protein